MKKRACLLAFWLTLGAARISVGCTTGLLTALGVATVDSTGSNRSNYSNNDTIGFQQRVNNAQCSNNRILFSFQVKSPSGGHAFSQTGNAVPGSVGNSQSQLTGVPISSFFSTPGTYVLQAFAQLDGQVLTQTVSFNVSSPNIILTYPTNGAQNLTDSPLTFQWVGSGAASYVVAVGNNPSFYNSVFSQAAGTGQSSLAYPINPSNPLQLLTVGTVYYWRVQGFDINGNLLATSNPPFSFTVASAGLTRDLAVVSLGIAGPADASGNIPFSVAVKDQGGTTESNVPLQFSLGGLVPNGSPAMIASIGPGVSMTFNFSAAVPPGQASAMAVACLQFFDDNMADNCQSLNISAAAGAPNSGPVAGPVNETPDQIWQQIEQLLAAQGISLTEYQLTGIEGQLTADQLASLLDALRQGQAQILLSGPPLAAPLPGGPVSSTGTFMPTFPIPPPEAPALPVSFSTSPSAGLTDQTQDQIWQAISQLLTLQGVDLTGYSLASIEGSLSSDQLAGLLDQLKSGQAQITLSGPPLAGVPGATPEQTATAATPPPVAAAPSAGPAATGSTEWSGIAPPLSDELRTFTISDDGAWRRIWPHLSSDPIPDVDFGRYSVVGIIAGKTGNVNDIDIQDIKKSRGGLRVNYRVSAAHNSNDEQVKSVVPYILRVAPRSGRAAQFIQIKEGPKDGEIQQQ
jgi:hypothetical protein